MDCPPAHRRRSNLLGEVNPFSPNRKVASRLNWGLRLYLKGVNNFWAQQDVLAQGSDGWIHISVMERLLEFKCVVWFWATQALHFYHYVLKDVSLSYSPLDSSRLITLPVYCLKIWSLLFGPRCVFCQNKHWFELHSVSLPKKLCRECMWDMQKRLIAEHCTSYFSFSCSCKKKKSLHKFSEVHTHCSMCAHSETHTLSTYNTCLEAQIETFQSQRSLWLTSSNTTTGKSQ